MDDLISDLNEDQKAAVLLPLTSPLIIQAGPGSGKTLTLAARIAKAVLSNRDKVNGCLVLTFSRNAVQEMKDRIGNYAATKPVHSHSPSLLNRNVDVCTFHSYSFKLIKNHFSLLGYSNPPIICNAKSSRKIMTSILPHYAELSHCLADSAEGRAALSAVLKCIRLAKMSADATEHLVRNERAPLIPVLRQYQQKLVQSGMIEYVDMIPIALNLLVTNQNVLQAELQRLPYVFCDEFQDTNRVQLSLLLTLASHGRVTIVGDTNQLIFGFQGAEQSNFSKFIDFFTVRKISVNFVPLRVNYRSTPSIVRASNSIASHQFPPAKVVVHSSTRSAPMEMVSSLTFSQPRAAEDDAVLQSFPVQIHESSSDSQEFAYISNLVLQLARGRVHSSFLRRHNPIQFKSSSIDEDLSAIDANEFIQLPPVALTDIAVLYRTNAIGNAFKEYLQTNYRQIPFTITSNSQQEDTDTGFDAPSALSSADTASSAKTFMHVVQQWLTFLLDCGGDSDLFLSILKRRFMSTATSASVSKITMNAIDTAELLFRQSMSTAPKSRSLFLILGDVLEANNDGSQIAQRRNGPAQKTYPHAKALKSWYVTICSMLSEIKAQEITLNRLVDKVIAASNVQAEVDAAINKLESAKRSTRGGSSYSSSSFQGRSAHSSSQSLKRSYADISSNRSVNTTNSFAPFEEDEEYLRVVNFVRDMKAEVSLFQKYRGGVSAKHHVDNVRFQLKGFVEHLQHFEVSGRRLNELSYKANTGNSLSNSQMDSSLSSSQSDHVSSQVSPLQGQLFLGTIHKAKGKEWKVVILLKANDDVFRFNTVSGGDGGEDDDDLVTASMEDERRLLFVALSRAKRLLVVSFVGKSREKLESELSRLLKPVLQLVGNSKQRSDASTAAGSGLPAVMYTFQHDSSKFQPGKAPSTAFDPSQSVWSKSVALGVESSFQKASSVIDADANKKVCVDTRPVRTPLDTINRPNSFQYHGRRSVDAGGGAASETSIHSKNSNFDWKLSSSSSSSSVQQSQSQSSTVAKGDFSSAVHHSGGYVDHRLSLRQPATQMPSSSLSRDSALQSYSKSDDFASSKDKRW